MTDRFSLRLQQNAVRHPYLWSLAIVAIVTSLLWLLQQLISTTNVPLFFLVAVLLCAALAGRMPAVIGAFLSFLAFKFFFVEPIFSFTINDITDLWQLLSFLAAALIGGAITAYAREQTAVARQQARELAILYDVSQSISAEVNFAHIAPVFVETTMQLLRCPACTLLLTSADGALDPYLTHGVWAHNHSIVETPLRSGEHTLGVLRIALASGEPFIDSNRLQLLDTLANQAALALERSRMAQLAAHAEALAESDRLKSNLLSAVSHDLRTPLASITAAADELMADDVRWTPAATRDFAQIIKGETTQLHMLVMNMLDLTRIEAGVLRPQRGWYNAAEIVYRVLQRLAANLEGHALEIDMPDDLPLIPVDYVQLEQVLWNVLQNALKYTPPNSALTLTAYLQANRMRLCIGDRGPGIPLDEHARVFQKFYRLPHTQHAGLPGAGLGLAICKGLVEANGGVIAISNRDGGGVLVTIDLPLNIDTAVEPEDRT
jgi:two-component system sensor histidine kinase KdpD